MDAENQITKEEISMTGFSIVAYSGDARTYLMQAMDKASEGKITEATVVDHIIPHRGDMKLFWDKSNWQPLCEHHHNVKTMTEDRYVEYKF